MSILLIACAESGFDLAPESRLPKWFDVPKGKVRADLKVTMDYYVKPNKREVVFKLYDENGKKLRKVKGTLLGDRPLELKDSKKGVSKGYPSYEVIIVNGITDIVEHRKMEPIFYMADDPAVLEELGIKS